MKKYFLLSLLLIPSFIIGCNKNATPGITNPFPTDEDYLKNRKIGFRLADSEQISRALSTNELNILTKTITPSATGENPYDKYIRKETAEIHKRDYTRAFAGEFKQGYSSSNTLNDTKMTVYQKIGDSKSSVKGDTRKLTVTDSNSISDYSYGQIGKKYKTSTHRYFMENSSGPVETTNLLSEYISDRITTTEQEKFTKTIDVPATEKKESGKVWDDSVIAGNFYIKQSAYLSAPNTHTGADTDSNVILYNESKKPYDEKGEFTLADGRKYRANVNTLIVSKLKLDTTKEWYLVDYARKYTETVITSEEIQPNTQITMLSTPIVIAFTEEIHSFSDKLEDKEIEALEKELEKITLTSEEAE